MKELKEQLVALGHKEEDLEGLKEEQLQALLDESNAKTPAKDSLEVTVARLSQQMAAFAEDNAALKKENARLSASLDSVKKEVGTNLKPNTAPEVKASRYKSFELEVKDAKGKVVETAKYELKPAGKKNNTVHNPLTSEFVKLDELIDEAKNGNPTVLNAIIAKEVSSKTPFKFCPFHPEEN